MERSGIEVRRSGLLDVCELVSSNWVFKHPILSWIEELNLTIIS